MCRLRPPLGEGRLRSVLRFLIFPPALEKPAVFGGPSWHLVVVVDLQPVILFIERQNQRAGIGSHKQRSGARLSRTFLPRQPRHELTHHVRAGLVKGQLALDGIARNNLGEHFVLPMESRPALEPQADADISYTVRNRWSLAVSFRPPSLIGNRIWNGIAERRQGLLARTDHFLT